MSLFKNFIQIAGISDKTEADLLLQSGINFLGFPLRLPVNKEDISEKDAAEIIKSLTPPQYGIVITYLNQSENIIRFCNEMNCTIVQLHGDIEVKELKQLKKTATNLVVIKSLIIGKYSESELLRQIDIQSEFVDAFITDSYNPVTGATGATGLAHDWMLSKTIVSYSSKPVILAGGLTSNNVADAIKFVKPAGVDSHTGVEDRSGKKTREKVEAFYTNAMDAFSLI